MRKTKNKISLRYDYKNDVVVDYKKRILHVEGIQQDGAETFVLARIYNTNKRVAVPMSSVKKHPFWA